jgi:hypothetical protein
MMRTFDRGFTPRQPRNALPLANLLPYLMCGRVADFEPLHLLDDGALGFALEFDPPVVDTQIGSEDAISGLIDRALRVLPVDVQWQWFVQSNSFIEPQLELYLQQTGADPLAQACTSHYVRRWRSAQREGFFPHDPVVNFFPRSQSILVALKSPPLRAARLTLETMLARTNQTDTIALSFVEAARNLQAVLAAQGIQATAVGADRLANWVADLLFPWRRFDHSPVSTGLHSVREAVASLGQIDPVELRGFRTLSAGEQAHHRVVSMLWHPRAVRAGMLNTLALLRPTLCVSLSARVLPLASSTLQLKAQSLLNARSGTRFNEVETQARALALSNVEERLFSEGERLVEGRLQVHLIEASAEEAEEAARNVCSYLREQDVEATMEEDIGSSLILRGCLPFAVYEATERKFRRRRRFLSRDFADMHPAGGCWKGIPPSPEQIAPLTAPIVMYSNPVGEALFLDPSKAESNPHALVVGQSGSGKSFFVHDYLLHLWRIPDVRLFLISIKPDYRKLALLLGRYIELTLDAAESLNPFAGAPTLENQARWVATLALMITDGRSGHYLAREQEIALQEASLAASVLNWDAELSRPIRETVLEDVCLELERSGGGLGRDLAFQLLPYRRGPFRRLFNGKRTVGLADRFIFFNLSNILRQPCSAAASFCVFSLIDQVMFDPSLRGVPKGLVADEVWALVQDPFAAAILERSLKAYRSLGGFALPIVQDPRDLDTPAGRVILVNTATKVILPMDRSGQDEISRFVRLNERQLQLVRSLRLVKRRYSEFFVSVEGVHSAKGLVIPDPLRYAISTTDPGDEVELERLYRQTGNMLETVQHFAREMPYGLRQSGTSIYRSHGRALWALVLVVLATAIGIALVTIRPRSDLQKLPTVVPERQIADGQRAAEDAVRLLSMPPGLVASGEASDPVSRNQTNESPSDAMSLEDRHRPAQTTEEPKTLAQSSSSTSPPSRADATTHSGARPPSRTPFLPSHRQRLNAQPLIPDQIENASPARGSDPLQGLSLQANLLTVDPILFPLKLLEIRADQGPPQVRFGQGSGGSVNDDAWFEAGDAPVSGWTLLRIEDNSASLMSSHGNLVHLYLPVTSIEVGDRDQTDR